MAETSRPSQRNEKEEAGSLCELLSRKEKRKQMKKMKRKQSRQQAAEKERIERELQLQDPAYQLAIRIQEEELAEELEKARIEHDIQEKLWLERERIAEDEAAERRRKKDEEEAEWEYVEEGPPEIIWEGNEIMVRKKKVKVPKGYNTEKITEDNRPVSNPLLPQSVAFEDHERSSQANKHQAVLDVMEQTPNFGTEQDKTHCPFHIKTGVCRFGVRCSRAHVYPDKSCTLLMKNMYNGPGLACELDEGLEYTDEEVEQHYTEFYEDVHGEFSKFGDLVNFKVCRNSSSHLRGNVYAHYRSIDSAIAAYAALNGRFYAGKQITCEFVGVTRWKVALCGEYLRARNKVCSHGSACNFLHCFRNPGGDYEWADWDNPAPSDSCQGNGRRKKDDWRAERHHARELGRRHHKYSRQSAHYDRDGYEKKHRGRDSSSDIASNLDEAAKGHRKHDDDTHLSRHCYDDSYSRQKYQDDIYLARYYKSSRRHKSRHSEDWSSDEQSSEISSQKRAMKKKHKYRSNDRSPNIETCIEGGSSEVHEGLSERQGQKRRRHKHRNSGRFRHSDRETGQGSEELFSEDSFEKGVKKRRHKHRCRYRSPRSELDTDWGSEEGPYEDSLKKGTKKRSRPEKTNSDQSLHFDFCTDQEDALEKDAWKRKHKHRGSDRHTSIHG